MENVELRIENGFDLAQIPASEFASSISISAKYQLKAYAAHLAAARIGRVVERLRALIRAKDHGDDISDFRTGRELARRKAAAAIRRKLKYLSATELAK